MDKSLTVKIGDIESLLLEYDIEVDSPDGWVSISEFVNKGMFQEYILETQSGKVVRCNENHLFETQLGWASAKECESFGRIYYLTNNGLELGIVYSTDNMIPIVDIKVDHDNHRYYTNGVSSHNTGGGKSAVKCSLAADFIRDGNDVLYITMELAEERVAERIDANLMNLPIGEVKDLPEAMFKDRMSKLKEKSFGSLVIKEYPTGSASVNNFNSLMEELKTKRGFTPKIVIIDYLQICCSASHRGNSTMNTYNMQKYIAEELRGFAVQHECLVLSSVQTNRSGFNVSDIDESTISDSAAVLFTADFVMGVIRTEELKEQNQVMFKQIKNRFGDPSFYNKFLCNMDTSRMKVSDIEDANAQTQYERKPEPSQANSGYTASSKAKKKMDDWDYE